METISIETESIDIDGGDITIDDAFRMIQCLSTCLNNLKEHFLALDNIREQDEIEFFKEIKPQILSWLLYFNKIHTIELKKPNGSSEQQQEHYQKELNSLTYFFGNSFLLSIIHMNETSKQASPTTYEIQED